MTPKLIVLQKEIRAAQTSVKKYLQHLKTRTGMSAEKRVRSDVVEKEDREERSALLLEKVSRQLETRNELAEKANVLADIPVRVFTIFIHCFCYAAS
jgi:division protein CdvB (Snf7/Vps24/ESCRT-III family)